MLQICSAIRPTVSNLDDIIFKKHRHCKKVQKIITELLQFSEFSYIKRKLGLTLLLTWSKFLKRLKGYDTKKKKSTFRRPSLIQNATMFRNPSSMGG